MSVINGNGQDNIPAFWSWFEPSRRPDWKRAVNVDMIMNMEIMLWASTEAPSRTRKTSWGEDERDGVDCLMCVCVFFDLRCAPKNGNMEGPFRDG